MNCRAREMTELQPRVAGLRRFGSAALDMAFIAAGRFDGYWERNLQPWDMAAGHDHRARSRRHRQRHRRRRRRAEDRQRGVRQ